jgi:uncharacterized protein YpmS
MILLTFLSIILIWLQVSSLRFMIRARSSQVVLEDMSRLEESIPAVKEETDAGVGPVILSLGVISLLNLVEIGYFIYCVYLFNDYAVITGSAILVGYSVYSMIRFLPKVRKYIRKPLKLLTERSEGYENIINILMAGLEVLFCSYILIRIFFTF